MGTVGDIYLMIGGGDRGYGLHVFSKNWYVEFDVGIVYD